MDIVDPNMIEKLGQAEAEAEGAEEEPEAEEAEEEAGEEAASAPEQEGASWGGWFSRLNTESLAKIAAEAIATVKRDIDEFKNAVAGAHLRTSEPACGSLRGAGR